MKKCVHIKSNGKRCEAYPNAGSKYCFFHDPKTKAAHRAACILGGKNRPRRYQIDYLMAIKGHLLYSVTDVCILCHREFDGLPCTRGRALHGRALEKYMDEHPFLYVLFFDGIELNQDYWWFAINDTREEGNPDIGEIIFTTSEKFEQVDLPTRPKNKDLDEIENMNFEELTGALEKAERE